MRQDKWKGRVLHVETLWNYICISERLERSTLRHSCSVYLRVVMLGVIFVLLTIFCICPKYPQLPTYNAQHEKKMRPRKRQGKEGLVTRFHLDGDHSPGYAPWRTYVPHSIWPVRAFAVETIRRHATGVQLLYLLYWNVFFYFFLLLCQKACVTDWLLCKNTVPRLRSSHRRCSGHVNVKLEWMRSCSAVKVLRTWHRPVWNSSQRMQQAGSLSKHEIRCISQMN